MVPFRARPSDLVYVMSNKETYVGTALVNRHSNYALRLIEPFFGRSFTELEEEEGDDEAAETEEGSDDSEEPKLSVIQASQYNNSAPALYVTMPNYPIVINHNICFIVVASGPI